MGRLRLRLSQKRLGELIGQDQAYVSRLERGHLPEISMTTLERLADALHVSMDFLAGRIDRETGVLRVHADDLLGRKDEKDSEQLPTAATLIGV